MSSMNASRGSISFTEESGSGNLGRGSSFFGFEAKMLGFLTRAFLLSYENLEKGDFIKLFTAFLTTYFSGILNSKSVVALTLFSISDFN